MKKSKSLFLVFLGVIFTLICTLSFVQVKVNKVYAYSEETYEQAGYNYLYAQYAALGMEYTMLEKYDAIDLYGSDDNINAKMMIVQRDDVLDYVILDFVIDNVDEFGFDQEEFISKFYGKGKIYYAGILNYAYYEGGQLYSINGYAIEEESFLSTLSSFEASISSSSSNTIDGGMYDYNEIEPYLDSLTSGLATINRTALYCIPGVAGTEDEILEKNYLSNIKIDRLYNNLYKSNYGVDLIETYGGCCVQTALTNMLVYYYNAGYSNILTMEINDHPNSFDTFASIVDYVGTDNSNINSMRNGTLSYIRSRGYYNSTATYDSVASYSDLVSIFKQDRPVFMGLFVSGLQTGHAVVGLGYLRYQLTYNSSVYYSYIRILDGWNSSSKPRYIDMNYYNNNIFSIDFVIN